MQQEESKNKYLSDLKKQEMKSKLDSICKNDSTKKDFQKYYILNNHYIKPQFLTEKMSINDNDVILKPLQKNLLIKLDDINALCKK
jgi:hypothetical protein